MGGKPRKRTGDVFGRRVGEVREEKGLTKHELADLSGVDAGFMSRIESGDAAHPTLSAAAKIADALGVPLDYLVGRTDELEGKSLARVDKVARAIVESYARLSQHGREELHRYAQFLLRKDQRTQKKVG